MPVSSCGEQTLLLLLLLQHVQHDHENTNTHTNGHLVSKHCHRCCSSFTMIISIIMISINMISIIIIMQMQGPFPDREAFVWVASYRQQVLHYHKLWQELFTFWCAIIGQALTAHPTSKSTHGCHHAMVHGCAGIQNCCYSINGTHPIHANKQMQHLGAHPRPSAEI